MHFPLFSAALQNRLTAGLCHWNCTYEDLPFIQVCSDPTPMHFNTGQGKMHSLLFSAALQNRLTAGLCHCNYTYEDLLFIQACSDPTARHCSTGFGKRHFPLFSAGLQIRLTAVILSLPTPVEICSSYSLAVTQHQRTAALVLARCICHCSVLLCKTGSQQSSCHCNYTCGDLPFIQACSDPTARHCSTGFGKRHFPLFSVGLQIRLTVVLLSLQLDLWRFALHTGLQ